MKISVEATAFVAAVKRLSHIATEKSTIPILGGLRMEAADDRLMLRACDLDRQLELIVKADVQADGVAVVSAAALLSALQAATAEAVEIETSETVARIKAGRRRAQLGLMSVDAFVEMPWPETIVDFDMIADDIALMPVLAKAAAGPKSGRYYLAGVHFMVRDGVVLAEATDGRVLLRRKLSGSRPDFNNRILPTGVANDLPVIAPDGGHAGFSETGFLLTWDGGRLSSKLVDGKYPDTDRVIPSKDTPTLADGIDRVLLASKAQAVAFASDHRHIQLAANGSGIELRAAGSSNEAEDVIDGEWAAGRHNEVIGINADKLAKVLGSMEADAVCLRQQETGAPIRIDPAGEVGHDVTLIMPVAVW